MSKFNPATWLNRARVNTNSSGDFSTSNNESLAGLHFASQSSLDIGSPSPSLNRHAQSHPHSHSHSHPNSSLPLQHSEGEVSGCGAGFCAAVGITAGTGANAGTGAGAGASPATSAVIRPPSFNKRCTSTGATTAASSTEHDHEHGHELEHHDVNGPHESENPHIHGEDLLRQWKYDDGLRGKTSKKTIRGDRDRDHHIQRGKSNRSINSNRSTSTNTDGEGDDHVNGNTINNSSNFVLHGHHSALKQQLQLPTKNQSKSKTKSSQTKQKGKHARHVSLPAVSTTKLHSRLHSHPHPPAADYSISMDSSDEDDVLNSTPGQIHRSESFGNVSHISGLSADETHYDGPGYGHGIAHVRNGHGHVHGHGFKTFDGHLQGHGHRSPRSSSHRVHPLLNPGNGKMAKGRDFGDAFDHLIHGKETIEVEVGGNLVAGNGGTKDGHSNGKGHYRAATSSSTGRRADKNLRRPTHMRAHTDTMALRGAYVQGNFHIKSKTLPAHATLRERIAKPQILQSRSTSNTVQSFSSTSTSGGNGKTGVVWNGQPMPYGAEHGHHHFYQQQHPVHHLPHVPSMGSGSGSYPSTTGDCHEDSSAAANSASNSSYQTQTSKLLGTRPRRCFHSPSTRSHSHGHTIGEDGDNKSLSLQDVPEDDPSTKWNDGKSMDGKSVLSGSTSTSKSVRGRVIKDEIKFIVTKFVPARLRKSKSKNVTLERSEGCLA